MSDDSELVTTPEAKTAPSVSFLGADAVKEFIRYFVSSGVALAVDVGVLTILTSYLGVPYLVSGALAFLSGLAVVYVLSIKWVFQKRALSDPKKEFLIFTVIGVVGLGINEIVLALFTGLFGFYYLVSKAFSIAIVFAWNFTARKMLLFRKT